MEIGKYLAAILFALVAGLYETTIPGVSSFFLVFTMTLVFFELVEITHILKNKKVRIL